MRRGLNPEEAIQVLRDDGMMAKELTRYLLEWEVDVRSSACNEEQWRGFLYADRLTQAQREGRIARAEASRAARQRCRAAARELREAEAELERCTALAIEEECQEHRRRSRIERVIEFQQCYEITPDFAERVLVLSDWDVERAAAYILQWFKEREGSSTRRRPRNMFEDDPAPSSPPPPPPPPPPSPQVIASSGSTTGVTSPPPPPPQPGGVAGQNGHTMLTSWGAMAAIASAGAVAGPGGAMVTAAIRALCGGDCREGPRTRQEDEA